MFDFAVVGGMVGLSTARVLMGRYPNAGILVLEKEGGELRKSTEVEDVSETEGEVEISTNRGTFRARSSTVQGSTVIAWPCFAGWRPG
jgi:protoporphyrinogen oxidase